MRCARLPSSDKQQILVVEWGDRVRDNSKNRKNHIEDPRHTPVGKINMIGSIQTDSSCVVLNCFRSVACLQSGVPLRFELWDDRLQKCLLADTEWGGRA